MVKDEPSNTLVDPTSRTTFQLSAEKLSSIVDLYHKRNFDEEIEELEQLGLDNLEASLKTSFEKGLSSNSDLDERIDIYGSNKKPEPELDTFWDICWDTMKDQINVLLQVLGVVSLIIGATGDHPTYGWIEGFAILLVVFIIVMVNGVVGTSKIKKFKELQEIHKNRAHISIMRDGEKALLHPEEVLVGDKIFLDTGDIIPADGVLLQSNSLLCNEAALTGENDLMHKENLKVCSKEKRNFKKSMKKNSMLKKDKHVLPSPIVISGTSIAQGNGWMIAIAVGPNSTEGKISILAEQEEEDTPLEQKLDDMAEKVSKAGLGAGLLALAALYLRFFIQLGTEGTSACQAETCPDELISYFLLAFTVVAVAVPEGLPMAVTISLAYSVKKMQKDNNLVKKLAACETMGGADCICSDKTGTLTQNRMVLKLLGCPTSNGDVETHDEEHLGKLFSRSKSYFEIFKEGVSICTSARVEHKNGAEVDVGAQTELAILKMLRKVSKDKDEYLSIRKLIEGTTLKINPFSSERKKSSIVIRKEESNRVYVIGAPDFIIKFCKSSIDLDMNIHSFGRVEVEKFLAAQEKMASIGLRTLSLAYRDFDDDELITAVDSNKHPLLENENLTVIALFGIYDPPRPGVLEAVQKCERAHIKVRMVTGDNAITAEAIAREVGITENSERVIEGAKFNYLVGGVMCEKCEDRKFVPNPEIKNDKQSDDFEAKTCSCPLRGDDSRNDVIANFDKFKEIIDNIDVIARCAPEHKYTCVTGLKQMGHIVAVTGDGTNDAPALRKANVGFAMGIAGTEYARQAADIILIDDNFGSIVRATVWGRGIYDNIQRFIQFQLTVNVVAVITCIVGAITIQQSCLTAVQMLWVNMIMDSLASLALATEEPTEEVLKRLPQDPKEFMVTPLMFKHIFGQAIPQVILLLIFMFDGENIFREFETDDDKVCHNPDNKDFVCSGRYYNFDTGKDYKGSNWDDYGPSRHFTYIFNIFIWFQLFNEINSRRIKDEISVFQGLVKAYWFIIIWFITASVQVIIVQVGYYALTVNKYGLTVEQWFTCIAWGCVPLLWRFVLLLIPGFGRKKLLDPEKSDTHLRSSIHGSKRHFSSSYRIV